jgi:hypothetical protein
LRAVRAAGQQRAGAVAPLSRRPYAAHEGRQPNLTAPPPRLNGTPDLSGVWEIEQTPINELKGAFPPGAFDQVDLPIAHSKYAFNLLWDVKPEHDSSRTEAVPLIKERAEAAFRDLPPTLFSRERAVLVSPPTEQAGPDTAGTCDAL